MTRPGTGLDRRAFLRAALAGATTAVAGAGLAACTSRSPSSSGSGTAADRRPEATEAAPTVPGSTTLLAYFSRAGENYWYGGRRTLDVGNTQIVAQMIGRLIPCDVYRIEAADPYSDDYDETVARNVREQDADARPAIAQPLPPVQQYDTVLLGSPIWNVRPPMILSTFLEGLDLSGTTVRPFVTYAVSGLGNAPREYASLAPTAILADALAVQGEEARDAEPDVERWLRAAGLLQA